MSSIALTAFRKGSDYTICHAKTDLVDRVRPVARAAGRAGTDKLHLLPENFPPLALLESRYIYVDTSKPRRRVEVSSSVAIFVSGRRLRLPAGWKKNNGGLVPYQGGRFESQNELSSGRSAAFSPAAKAAHAIVSRGGDLTLSSGAV